MVNVIDYMPGDTLLHRLNPVVKLGLAAAIIVGSTLGSVLGRGLKAKYQTALFDAMGFAATLASECGVRVFCGAYRLAPENPYPAALEDALTAYDYLLKKGYAPQQILLCGESAGGGLICALCLRLKQLGRALPCGLIAISLGSTVLAAVVVFAVIRMQAKKKKRKPGSKH